ncbi:MAG: glycosyl hydrolase 115 family protein [Cyclobacteriaceae bacterium]|nr:glycosyl hydrolase 115 family protein [Cyclobacteriaceae bacterium]
MRKYSLLLVLLPYIAFSQLSITDKIERGKRYFPIKDGASAATICYDTSENILVGKSAVFLADDIERVSGKRPDLSTGSLLSDNMIIVGTVGNNRLIDKLIAEKKISDQSIRGGWERFIIQTIKAPFPGVKQALVVIGSDRRGVAYGLFSLSEAMGVSPWYWWADVPVKKKENIFLENIHFVSESPAVKYRGIFINDESPAFRYWAKEKFGGSNHKCYETIFELLLRNKANFLWPAMWLPTMFNVDDPLNPKTADEYGIVMSTSHHEPMMRAHNEWNVFNGGAWNYITNKEKLREFWRGGIERMKNYESIVTIGMRGDGDEAMVKETAVDLLQTIVRDQREIIADVIGKPADKTPQVWAIYKEVQDYYDKGTRVDNDITVLLADDNWGNIRYLPKKKDLDRSGGYGMYYHFDYVGAPVSYRWLNVTQIERVWEQMKLTYEHGVDRIWIVNVGDIKPMEFPISFFFEYAWKPDAIQAKDLPGYYVRWAKNQFGEKHAQEIAELISLYTKYNARRTHEMIKPETYSIENYREADRVVSEYKQLVEKSNAIYKQLPENYHAAFYQLVHSPIEKSCNLLELYVAAGKSKLYAKQGRSSANRYADKVKELFDKDAELVRQYHEELAGGKWNHMMSQTKFGYTSWNHPRVDVMPAVSFIRTKSTPTLGYTIEYGAEPEWGGHSVEGYPLFSKSFIDFDPINRQNYFVEIFNMGEGFLNYSVETKNDWIQVSKTEGSIQFDEKVLVSIDWERSPKENGSGEIIIKGAGKEYVVKVPIRNVLPRASGFVENNGVVSIEAANYTRKVDAKDRYWSVVSNLGRTHSSVIIEPVNIQTQRLDKTSPRLEYDFTVFKTGEVKIGVYISPTQDFKKQDGLKYAISIDDEEPQIINANEGEITPDYKYADWWMKSVADHIKIRTSNHNIIKPGQHTLKLWTIDSGIVFQKIVIDAGGLRQSYLGPPESLYLKP